MPQSPDSEIPIYSSSDEMRSRPFERAERESARTNDPLRAAHEFLFRGSAGGSSETPSESHEVEPARKSGTWLIPVVVGSIILGVIIGYTASSVNKEQVSPVEMTPGKIIPTTQTSEMYGAVVGADVRVRRSPNLDAEIITRVNSGDRLKVIGTDTNGWYPVEIPSYGERSYVFGAYLATDGNKVLNLESNISMMSMPDFSSPIIETIPYGSKVMAIPYRDNWYKTYLPDGRAGYINVNIYRR